MKQKKLKTSAKFLSVILNIGCIILGSLIVLLAIGIIVTACMPFFAPDVFQSTWKTALNAGQDLSFSQCIVFFICCLGELVCIFLSLYNAKKIFGCIGKGNSPFQLKTAVQIRKIAVYIIIFAVISVISVFKMSFPSLLMCGIFALILFCISLIFDYGCELQQEVDETL